MGTDASRHVRALLVIWPLCLVGCDRATPGAADTGPPDTRASTDGPAPEGHARQDGPSIEGSVADTASAADLHAPPEAAVSDTGAIPDAPTFPCPIVTDLLPKVIPVVTKPAYLVSSIDPVFGHKVTRVTGDPGQPVPVVGGTWGDPERHHYSKTMAWNIDMTLLAINKRQGARPALFLDGKTYGVLFARSEPGECRWHPQQPGVRICVKGNVISTWEVWTGTNTPVATFSGYTQLRLGPGEGNLSLDGKRLAVVGQKASGMPVAFAYDLSTQQKYPDIDLQGLTLDWVSISPLGNYVVYHGDWDQTQVYNLQGQKVGPYWYEYSRPSHYDLTVDDSGDEVAVGVSKWTELGKMIKRRLKDGKVTPLTQGGWLSHTSTRNLARPGWAYGTYESPLASYPPFVQEIVAVKLDGSFAVQRLAHTHALYHGYITEAHGSPSPDGKRVVWASNWGDTNGPVSAYVVEVCGGP